MKRLRKIILTSLATIMLLMMLAPSALALHSFRWIENTPVTPTITWAKTSFSATNTTSSRISIGARTVLMDRNGRDIRDSGIARLDLPGGQTGGVVSNTVHSVGTAGVTFSHFHGVLQS